MKKQKTKIDWELFDGNSSTREAMYLWLFGGYGFFEFQDMCNWFDEAVVEIKKMKKMGIKAARKDCMKWLKKEYSANHIKEVLNDYCSCSDCPVHNKAGINK